MITAGKYLRESWKNLKLPRSHIRADSPNIRFASTNRLSITPKSRVSTPRTRSPTPSSLKKIRILPLDVKPKFIVPQKDLQRIYTSRCRDLKISQNKAQEFRFYRACEKNLKNRIFNLKEQELGPSSGLVIGELLQSSSDFCCICLSNNHLGDQGVTNLAELVHKNECIIYLDLSSNELTTLGLKGVLDLYVENENVVFLDFSSYNGLNRNKFGLPAAESLMKVLATSKVLQFLMLNEVNLTDSGLEKLSKGLAVNKSLIKLSLVNNYLTHKHLEEFSKAVQDSCLEDLNLSQNKISDQGVSNLAFCLADNDFVCKIQRLDLSENEITHKGASMLFTSIRYSPVLTHLNINNNPLGPYSGQSLHFLLLSNFSLRELSLSSCKLKNDGINHLALGLSKNKCLLSLNLSNNLYTDVSILCEGLCENDVLADLDLSNNMITDAEELAKALKVNKSLQNLNLKENRIKEEYGLKFVETAKFAQKLIKLHLEGNYFTVWTLKEIQKTLKKNEALLIRAKNPSLRESLGKLQTGTKNVKDVEENINKKQAEKVRLVNKLSKLKEKLNILRNTPDDRLAGLKIELRDCKERSRQLQIELDYLLRDLENMEVAEERALKEKNKKIDPLAVEINRIEEIRKQKTEVNSRKKFVFNSEIIKLKDELKKAEFSKNVALATISALYTQLDSMKSELHYLKSPNTSYKHFRFLSPNPTRSSKLSKQKQSSAGYSQRRMFVYSPSNRPSSP